MVARAKVIWGHCRGKLNIGDSTIPPDAMIDILGWFSNKDKFRQLVWPCEEEFAPPLKGDIDNNMLDAMYRIMRVRPDLFNSKTIPSCSQGL